MTRDAVSRHGREEGGHQALRPSFQPVRGRRRCGKPSSRRDDPARPVDALWPLEAGRRGACARHQRNQSPAAGRLRRGAGGNWAALRRLAGSAVPLPFASVRNRRSLLFVDNLVSALLLLIELPQERFTPGTYMIADAEPVGLAEILSTLRHGLGMPARLFAVPTPVLRSLLKLARRDRMAKTLLGRPRGRQHAFQADLRLAAADRDSGRHSPVGARRRRLDRERPRETCGQAPVRHLSRGGCAHHPRAGHCGRRGSHPPFLARARALYPADGSAVVNVRSAATNSAPWPRVHRWPARTKSARAG